MKKRLVFKLSIFCVLVLLCFSTCKKNKENEPSSLSVTTISVTDITSNSAKCNGKISFTGNYTVGNCGSCWSETPSPTTDDFFTTDIQGQGQFVSKLKNLKSNTKYYVRVYAITSSGIMYGEELDFITESNGGGYSNDSISVFTNDVTDITSSSAKCGGNIIIEGNFSIIAKGVCWGLIPNPTIENNHTYDGQGINAFTSNITGLISDTTYYVKAYASLNNGNTVYGNQKTFHTAAGSGPQSGLATVSLGDIYDIHGNTAKCNIEVTDDGGSSITNLGICWSISDNPMMYNYHVSCGVEPGIHTLELQNLESGTTYHVRAYVINSMGTAYSQEEKVFTTLSKPQVSTSEITNITIVSATGHGVLINDGGASTIKGFCWSKSSNPEPTINDNFVQASGSGIGEFTAQLTNLEPNTTYFVRTFATNEVDTSYGNMVTFKTNSSWLSYGNGELDTSWGFANGGTITWAVMFPSSLLPNSDDFKLTKIKISPYETLTYTVHIYEGGSNTPTTLLTTQSFTVSTIPSSGYMNLTLTNAVHINHQKNLWIVLSCDHQAGQYPASCSIGIGNPNSRWVLTNSGWVDAYTSGWSNNRDFCWIIQAYLSKNNKNEEIELSLPYETDLYPNTNPLLNSYLDCNFGDHGVSPR